MIDAMNYLHYEIDADAGDRVEVTLDRAANVQLLDPLSYANYQNGQGFSYYGGYATTSPVHLDVPYAGHWHVVIDLGGGPGSVRASVRVIPKATASRLFASMGLSQPPPAA
jgi:hypothetical protein